jgi:branched-chain amino acid transport system permease protein
VAAFGRLRELLASYLALFVTGVVMLLGLSALIEMGYHLQLNAAMGDSVTYLGMALNTRSVGSWLGAAMVAAIGFGAFEWVRRRFAEKWAHVQSDIERDIKRQEMR